jgi:hypothetical protein
MEIVGNLETNRNWERLALAISRLLLARESGASAPPNRTTGRTPCREVNPLP